MRGLREEIKGRDKTKERLRREFKKWIMKKIKSKDENERKRKMKSNY